MCYNLQLSADPCRKASIMGCLRHISFPALPWLLCHVPIKALSAHTHFRADLCGLAFPGDLLRFKLSIPMLEQLMTQHALLDKVRLLSGRSLALCVILNSQE